MTVMIIYSVVEDTSFNSNMRKYKSKKIKVGVVGKIWIKQKRKIKVIRNKLKQLFIFRMRVMLMDEENRKRKCYTTNFFSICTL